ncbi:MAG TPA: Mov34/MPN/PAD-1 family protein [candidate division Zixibacteria bacterium]|nr:Mov34/MPN/PAD-1 family protein [candidate division Zixibacteria bacterium]
MNNSEKKSKKLLSDLLGETEPEFSDNKENNPSKSLNDTGFEKIFPVYILHRVVYETIMMCKKAMPSEAIGILLGYKMQYNDQKYVKVVDWVTGNANQSHVFAEFTPEGVRQYTTLIQEKYGDSENRPRIVGIIHSHPFGSNPHFSGTDYNTFLNFPYDAEHNVFVLVDPKSGYYKSYIVIVNETGQKDLKEVDWVEYNVR